MPACPTPNGTTPAHPAGSADGAQPETFAASADERLAEVAQSAADAFGLLPIPPDADSRVADGPARRLETDPDTVERDLIKLVLTIVELLRQLMERTAVHRVDQGDLSEDQEERVGMTLMILEDRMTELCERYGLTMGDLNLDLGPLGSLLPPGQS
ncbi:MULTISPECIES: gas vesicle protein K [unclassified Streptomyces]|uniref:gas vesicle protein K n=1 Tax=unclassified Streptomyces TaxID=2593676 RepID=UPI000DB9F4D8|nr:MULTISPECIES: gas vesicle protein K [unclassified Streptomyces]MYT68179.1 gas vesicle protein K [Streptomyces sp. SID8367]RAJ72747.1 gas vesicle protein GvpK [Streptomyces sp. PsTaAH-137]